MAVLSELVGHQETAAHSEQGAGVVNGIEFD
jgi:hypothetical protein